MCFRSRCHRCGHAAKTFQHWWNILSRFMLAGWVSKSNTFLRKRCLRSLPISGRGTFASSRISSSGALSSLRAMSCPPSREFEECRRSGIPWSNYPGGRGARPHSQDSRADPVGCRSSQRGSRTFGNQEVHPLLPDAKAWHLPRQQGSPLTTQGTHMSEASARVNLPQQPQKNVAFIRTQPEPRIRHLHHLNILPLRIPEKRKRTRRPHRPEEIRLRALHLIGQVEVVHRRQIELATALRLKHVKRQPVCLHFFHRRQIQLRINPARAFHSIRELIHDTRAQLSRIKIRQRGCVFAVHANTQVR